MDIDQRNLENRLASMDASMDSIAENVQLQRAQLIGVTAMLILLGVGLWKMGRMMPA